jgi:hypothetical protein
MLENQIDTFEAVQSRYPRSSQAAQIRRNAVARRKLEALRDSMRLRAALADVWDNSGAA